MLDIANQIAFLTRLLISGRMAWHQLQPCNPLSTRECHQFSAVGELLYCYGGNDQNKRFGAETGEVKVFNPATLTWGRLPLQRSESNPGARSAHGQCLIPGNKILVQGGWDGNAELNDVHVLDLGQAQWSKWEAVGQKPPPRHFHVIAYVAARESVYMFGGFNGESWLGDCWAFHLPTRVWTQIDCTGQAKPCERASAVAFALHGDTLLVHGGYSGSAFLGDLWLLHTAAEGRPGNHRWQRIARATGSPTAFLEQQSTPACSTEPRGSASAAPGSPPLSPVPPPTAGVLTDRPLAQAPYGGASHAEDQQAGLADVWGEDAQLLAAAGDSRARVLSALQGLHPAAGGSRNEWPAARSGHNGVQLGPLIIIFGGRFSGGRYNDVHVLNTEHMTWTRIQCTGEVPPTRKTHASARIGTDLYMCGGHSGDMWLGDMFQLDLRSVLRQVAPPLSIPRPPPSLQSDLARLLLSGNADGNMSAVLQAMNILSPQRWLQGAPAADTTSSSLLDASASCLLLGVTSALRSQVVPPRDTHNAHTRRGAAISAAVAAHRAVDVMILQRYNLDCSPALLVGDAHAHSQHAQAQPWAVRAAASSSGTVQESAITSHHSARSSAAPSASGGAGSGVAPGGEAHADASRSKSRRTASTSTPSGAPVSGTETALQLAPRIAPPPPDTLGDLSDCSDLVLHTGNARFHVHAVILKARSSYFRSMLSGKWAVSADCAEPSKAAVHLHEVRAPLLSAALQWMYTDTLPSAVQWQCDTLGLLQTADLLGCAPLAQLAQRQLEATMTLHTAPQLLQSADELNAELLRQAALAFMARAFEVCSLTSGYQRLPRSLRDEVLCFRRCLVAGGSEHSAAEAARARRVAAPPQASIAGSSSGDMAVAPVSPPAVGGCKRPRDEVQGGGV